MAVFDVKGKSQQSDLCQDTGVDSGKKHRKPQSYLRIPKVLSNWMERFMRYSTPSGVVMFSRGFQKPYEIPGNFQLLTFSCHQGILFISIFHNLILLQKANAIHFWTAFAFFHGFTIAPSLFSYKCAYMVLGINDNEMNAILGHRVQ